MIENEKQKIRTSEEETKIEQEIAVTREMFWQIIEWSSDEKALTLYPWLTKQSLADLRCKIAENRARES